MYFYIQMDETHKVYYLILMCHETRPIIIAIR
jgi:5-keto 4-deoxyuronate isomerase